MVEWTGDVLFKELKILGWDRKGWERIGREGIGMVLSKETERIGCEKIGKDGKG